MGFHAGLVLQCHRFMLLAVAMWVLSAAPAAPQRAPAPAVEQPTLHFLGAAFDVGVPDGAALSVLLFPRTWVQVGVGALTHLGGAGVRVSVAISPIPGPVRPLFAMDYGHYFPGDFSWALSGDAKRGLREALKGVQYDFVNAHLGLELGAGRFSFAIRGGVSYVTGTIGGFEDTGVRATGPNFKGVIPSGKLGLTWYFF